MKDGLPGDQMGTCQQPYITRSAQGKKIITFCKIFKHRILRCCVKKKQIGCCPLFSELAGAKQSRSPHLSQHPSSFCKSSKEGAISRSYFPLAFQGWAAAWL